MKPIALLLLALPTFGQSNLGLSCSVPNLIGDTVTCPIVMSGAGTPAAIEAVVSVTAGTTPVPFTVSTGITGKAVSGPGPTGNTIISGANTTAIPAGTIGTISFKMIASSVTVNIPQAFGAWPDGGVLTVTVNPPVVVALPVSLSKCDINGDGFVTQADADAWRATMLTTAASSAAVVKLVFIQVAVSGGTCQL